MATGMISNEFFGLKKLASLLSGNSDTSVFLSPIAISEPIKANESCATPAALMALIVKYIFAARSSGYKNLNFWILVSIAGKACVTVSVLPLIDLQNLGYLFM